ncbi:MAG: UbiH/UbiF/VisC/COQ6 family ubiquinone biosynthesis hydroxylase [Cellvibrionaceae bacterium]
MKTTPFEYDVIIVGAGLVGASLAASIAANPVNQHLSIGLIEQAPAPEPSNVSSQPPEFDARVVALTQASIELLKEIDAWDEVLGTRACPYRSMRVWDNDGTGDIYFSASELGQSELGFIVENRIVLNTVLEVVGRYHNIHTLRGHSVTSVEYKEEKQSLILSDGSEYKTSLLVAADGGHSKIRDLAGLPVRQWDYQHKAIVTTVRHEQSHQSTAWQNFLVTGPLAFLPLGDASEKYSSIVWSLESKVADEYMNLSDADFQDALGKAFEYRLGTVEAVTKRYSFPLVQRHAVDYIAPQLALVGDAAHTIHPLAGQGVNLGLLDVGALSKEISRSSSRQLTLSDPSLLRRYQRQRKKHNLEVMLLMESFKRLFGSRNLAVRWLRNSGLKVVDRTKPIKNWLAKQAMGL